MEEVHIQLIDKEWAAFVGGRQVTKRACKGCTINIIRKMTAKSHRYHKIIVFNEDGTKTTIETGATDARDSKEA